MNALDTNVLVRFLTADDQQQAETARKIFLNAEASGDTLFIPIPVVLETIWVLASAYGYSKKEIIGAFEALLVLPVPEFEAHSRIVEMCSLATMNNIDLPDLLIGLTSRDNSCVSTYTFDKKASRSPLFTLIQ